MYSTNCSVRAMDESDSASTELSVCDSPPSKGINLAKLAKTVPVSKEHNQITCQNNHAPDHHYNLEPNNGEESELKMEIVDSSYLDTMTNGIDDIDGILNNLDTGEGDDLDKSSDLVTSSNNEQGMIELSSIQEYIPEDIPDTYVTSSKKDKVLSDLKTVVSEDDQQAVSSTTMLPTCEKGHSFLKEWFKRKNAQRKKVKDHYCYICKICKFISNYYSTIYSHIKVLHSRILLQSGNRLKKHYERVKSPGASLLRSFQRTFTCQYCEFFTKSQTNLVKHHRQLHDKHEIDFSSSISKSFTKRTATRTPKPFSSRPTEIDLKQRCLASLKRSNHRVKQCIFCLKRFQTYTKLSHHYRMYHNKEGPQKDSLTGLYHCKLCLYHSVSVPGIRLHYGRSHFMNAFYAWNIPQLESFFAEQDKLLKSNLINNSKPDDSALENTSDVLHHSATWSPETAKSEHFSVMPIPCIACEFSDKNVLALMEHYRLVHEDSYPRGFKQFILEYLKLYMKTVRVPKSDLHLATGGLGAKIHSNNTVIQSYKFDCQLCRFRAFKLHEMANHFENIHPNVKYSISHIETLESYNSNISSKSNSAIYKCEFCEFPCENTELSVIRHYREHHPDVSYTDALLNTELKKMEYSCRHCGFKGNCENMERHYIKSHPDILYDMDFLEGEDSVDFSTHSCKACAFNASSKVNLANHYEEQHLSKAVTFCSLNHEGDSRYRCTLCLAILPTLTAMARHHAKHTNDSPGKTSSKDKRGMVSALCCKVCSHIFSSCDHLWLHVTQLHVSLAKAIKISDLPSYVLEFGYFRDVDIQSIQEHRIKSKVVKRRRSKLPGSESNMSDSELFTNDRNTEIFGLPKIAHSYHDTAELNAIKDRNASKSLVLSESFCRSVNKTPSCKFCSFCASSIQNLCHHLQLVHKHDLSFRCFKCCKESSTLCDCLRHHSHVHGLNLEKATAYNFLLNDIITHGFSDGKIKHVCSWCKYTGFSRAFVVNHFNQTHMTSNGKEKSISATYVCKWCDYGSKNGNEVQAHVINKHGRSLSLKSLSLYEFSKDDSSTESSNEDEESVKQQQRKESQKLVFRLVEECAFGSDSDFSDKEVYESAHVCCKHHLRYPHVCKYCKTAYLCSTTYLKHCLRQHSDCCSASTAVQRICVLPDSSAIPAMLKKLKTRYDISNKKSVFYNGQWPCVKCTGLTFSKLEELQEHVHNEHDGNMIYMCCFCEFLSDSEKTIMWHTQLHNVGAQAGSSAQSSIKETVLNGEKITEDIQIDGNDPELSYTVEKDDSSDVLELSETATHLQSPLMKRARKSTRRNPRSFNVFKSIASLSSDGDKRTDSRTEGTLEDRDHDDDAELYLKHSTIHAGLLRCKRCSFMCANPERMQAHIKSTHLSTKGFVCKFCDYCAQDFKSMDQHLATFHKIKKNCQLGLQIRYAVNSSEKKAFCSVGVNMKGRFLYTPTPCLPIMKAKVRYLSLGEGEDSGHQNRGWKYSALDAGASCSDDGVVISHLENEDTHLAPEVEFSCSYCGYAARSTYHLEVHMRRHERNFQDEDCLDKINYNMGKFGMAHKYP